MPNTSRCWRRIWYQSWRRVIFFSMTYITDHVHIKVWLANELPFERAQSSIYYQTNVDRTKEKSSSEEFVQSWRVVGAHTGEDGGGFVIIIVIMSRYHVADISDPLSPPLPIVHCFWQVFRATSSICTELLYVYSSWTPCLCSSMWRGPQEYITYELVPTSQAVSRMSGSGALKQLFKLRDDSRNIIIVQ